MLPVVSSMIDIGSKICWAKAEWGLIFEAAGLDYTLFRETESDWITPLFTDETRTWTSETPDLKLENI